MKYKQILKALAQKENVSKKQIEREMIAAIKSAGLNCSPKEFIEEISSSLTKRLYIV